MNHVIKHLGLVLAASVVLVADPTRGAPQSAESDVAEAQLADVRSRIAALTTRLGAELQHRDALGARLRAADLGITAARRRLESLRGEQAAAERRRGEIRNEQTQVEDVLDAERAALSVELRAAYMIGRQERLKLLLNQRDPAAAGRMSAYYGYFARARARRVDEIDGRVLRLQQLAGQMDLFTAKLEQLQSAAAQELTELNHARESRVVALAAVSQTLSTGNQELGQLKRQELAEEALLADLARVLRDLPIDTQRRFEELRGKLPWPVEGRLISPYRESHAGISPPGSRWNGVLIESARGAKVRAAYFGRVVYADWLQGLGLLIIIGHSNNYLTLYGHAEVLYKAVGDWVAPGDIIAGLGDSSGAAPQLYFEIRAGRTPQDPKAWLKPVP